MLHTFILVQGAVHRILLDYKSNVTETTVPGRQEPEQRRASEESPGQGWILTAPAGFTGDLRRQSQDMKSPDLNSMGGACVTSKKSCEERN